MLLGELLRTVEANPFARRSAISDGERRWMRQPFGLIGAPGVVTGTVVVVAGVCGGGRTPEVASDEVVS